MYESDNRVAIIKAIRRLELDKQQAKDAQKEATQVSIEIEQSFKAQLEDAALLILKTGGITQSEKILKCRKLDYYGDAGDFYFEQPSINVIESGLWQASANSEGNLPRITRIETISRSSDAIDAIRFTYSKQAPAPEE